MFEIFLFYLRDYNNRGVVSRGIINFSKVFVEFSLVVNNTLLEVDIRGRGDGFITIRSLCINIVTVLLYVIDKVI